MVDWTKNSIIPRNGLLAWHQYEEGVSSNTLINDYSGGGRHLTVAAGNTPVLTSNVLNGQPGWYFNGTRDPFAWSGSLGIKHTFIVASYEDAAFPDYKGLFTGVTLGDLLTGNNSGDTFFNNSYSPYEYRKADVVYAQSNQKAPMSGNHAVIEVLTSGSLSADGVQIGKQRNLSGRLWKGFFFEDFVYNVVLNELARSRMYQYFAMRYHLWQKTAAGLDIFPFPANKTRSLDYERENFISEPYDGPLKSLVRGSFKGAYGCQFLLREQAEFEAAQAFFDQHSPITDFVFRDYRYYPYKDITVRYASSLREQGSDTTYRFNYSFDVLQTA